MAREFKRRMGDPTPVLLGGSPRTATALTAGLLAHVVAAVAGEQGDHPDHLIVTCPANWGPFKRDLLAQAVDLAGVGVGGGGVTIVSEPEAVAAHYAASARVEPGQLVAVYDLGGGTFDAAVLVNTGDGHRVVGEPTGIEQLGGIDFDDAVLAHVAEALIDLTGRLDPDDPALTRGLELLRRACVEAKEALSHDTEVVIPVALPDLHTEVRLTRAEFERLIRPTLGTTLDGLRRALRSADVEPEALTAVLLAGGSSRIPLVAQMVTEELGRPVAVDIHPKHAVALGAARLAARTDVRPASPPPPAPVRPPLPEPEPTLVAPVEPRPATAPVAASEPADRARRRGRRLAWAGLAALTVAALAWPTVGTGDGDRGPDARAAAATDQPGADGGRGSGGAARGATLDPSVTHDADDREGQGSREPSSPGTPGGGTAPSRGGTSSGSGGAGAGAGGEGSPATTAPQSPSPTTTTPGPGPTTPPPQPVIRPWHAVEAGTCLGDVNPDPPSPTTSVEVSGCDTPHGYEVMGILDNPAQPYPGQDE